MATDNTVTPIGNLTVDPELRSEQVSPSRIHQHRRFS
jgi:single-stranded DNA-binding protein